MTVDIVIAQLKKQKNRKNVEGMARFGINPKNALGIGMPVLRKLAKDIGKDHVLAGKLWKTKIHEARILAGMIDDPEKVTEKQMDRWVKDFNSWDLCDQVCSNLFDKTEWAVIKAYEWSGRDEEFVKRAGFVIQACKAVHDKKAGDKEFSDFLAVIKREAADERNFVKKAVNWALRQIGKRNMKLNKAAIKTAKEILKIDSKAAKWVAKDALKELTDIKVKARIKST